MNQNLNCEHFGPCGGCVFDAELGRFPLVREAQSYFLEKGVVETPVHYFGAHGWRTRAKLAVRGFVSHPTIGLFKKNSHSVLSIPHCRVHHPSINTAVECVRRWIVDAQIPPYNEADNSGVLRYLQCTVERSSGKVQLALVCNEIIPKEIIQKLWESTPFWHSIWINLNSRADNVIFGEMWDLQFGEEWLWERLAGVDCCIHPAGFAQANLTAYEALLVRVGELITSPKKVIEYYAGAGVIGLTLAAKGCEVNCFESNRACESAFEKSKTRLTNGLITWTCSTTEAALGKMQGCDVVVVDPPRKGLDPKTLEAFSKAEAGMELVYVSCGWDSCKRNLDFLLKSGWTITLAEIYIFFPGSDHIETLQLLTKIK